MPPDQNKSPVLLSNIQILTEVSKVFTFIT